MLVRGHAGRAVSERQDQKRALEEIRKDHELAIKTIVDQGHKHNMDIAGSYNAHLASKEAEIKRLVDTVTSLGAERDRLLKRFAPDAKS